MMPATAKTPAITESSSVCAPGIGSPVPRATGSMAATPTASTTIAIAYTDARRPVQPPPKSPAPQLIAEARPNATTPRSAPDGSAVRRDRRHGFGASVIDLARTVEDDDGIRCLVVP